MDIENTQSVAESNRKRAALIKKLAEQKRAQMLAKKQSKITARQIGLTPCFIVRTATPVVSR